MMTIPQEKTDLQWSNYNDYFKVSARDYLNSEEKFRALEEEINYLTKWRNFTCDKIILDII